MGALTLLLVVLVATALSVPLANRLRLPYPILLLLVGMLLALVPGVPALVIPPELILPLVLPPVLYTAARRTSWTEFAQSWRAIGLLAVALVLVTAFAVGAVLQLLVPGLGWAAALVLGAMVGPPDPVAATAVAARLKLPRRLTTILIGEGVSNDATALILYDVAVAAVVTGAFSAWTAGGLFGLSAVVGVSVGLALAWVSRRILDRLPADPARPALSFVMPFVAYLAAGGLHGSGVLAVVTLALSLGRAEDQGGALARTQAGALWQVVELLVTGAAFAFVGLELRSVLDELDFEVSRLLGQIAVISAVCILVRFAWIFPIAWLNERTRVLGGQVEDNPTGWREMAVASWSGMRGVVTLATALALPLTLDDGTDFPERGRLVAIAFGVTVVTLLLQGLSLPLLVGRLGVQEPPSERRAAERELTARALTAGRERLEQLRRDADDDLVDEALEVTEALLHRLDSDPAARDEAGDDRQRRLSRLAELEGEMLAAARRAVIASRGERGSDPRVVDEVLARLDARGMQPRVAPED
ncbi:MAG: Na+/H+ antiporter [Geodermatophilaceae bacterium]|nr:Na+/H+ antiporter [Geodermatophilaceae bacterium]MDQ3455646.1 Na+/H+ antiporter [Actinomycetota bacterium]